jgi:polar amino acid transport system substrate-binding protein
LRGVTGVSWPVPVLVVFAAFAAGPRPDAGGSPVRIVTELLPPFNYEKDGRIVGASTDVVRAVMEKAGLRCSIELFPWRRALDTALHEKNVFIYTVARTREREGKLVWVGRICLRKLALYCLADREDLLRRSLAELHDATIAVVQGDASEQRLRAMGFGDRNLHVLRDATAPLASEHVLEGRSDFFVSNPYRQEYTVRGTPLGNRFRLHSVIWEGDGYYLAANPRSDGALVARVQQAFAALESSGEVKAILARTLPDLGS